MTKLKGTGYFTEDGDMVAWLQTDPLTERPLVHSGSKPNPNNFRSVSTLPNVIRAALAQRSGMAIEDRQVEISV